MIEFRQADNCTNILKGIWLLSDHLQIKCNEMSNRLLVRNLFRFGWIRCCSLKHWKSLKIIPDVWLKQKVKTIFDWKMTAFSDEKNHSTYDNVRHHGYYSSVRVDIKFCSRSLYTVEGVERSEVVTTDVPSQVYN